MSVDEVLASNLWLWPDPLLKRDRAGRIMFVNAVFLQLYGGQAQDWYGKPLPGWPAPVTHGAQRFETRTGEGADEAVYDWIESVMADGNALAIARNVTVFMTPPVVEVAPPPAVSEPVAPPTETPPAPVEPPAPVLAQDEHPAPAPAPSVQQAAPDLADEIAETRSGRVEEHTHEDNQTNRQAGGQAGGRIQAPPSDQPAQNPIEQQQVEPRQVDQQQAGPQEQPREERRMIERRALPIKDSTVVLGSNWRDEVIAKAVGATAPEGADEHPDTAIPSEPGDEAQNAPAKTAEGLCILLAEDNAINALLTRTLLEADGAEVDTVEDGALALAAVQKKAYDLIFMDMRMPNMDGLEATRKIRAFGGKMPIIALTANAFDDDRNACFDSGMNDFMTKPVSAEELSEMVTNWTKEDGEEKLAS